MFKLSPRRNQRSSKGFKVKHALQICVLLGVCIWLLYQVRHSRDKKAAAYEKSVKNGNEVIKLGRKDLQPEVEDSIIRDERHEEDEEEERKLDDNAEGGVGNDEIHGHFHDDGADGSEHRVDSVGGEKGSEEDNENANEEKEREEINETVSEDSKQNDGEDRENLERKETGNEENKEMQSENKENHETEQSEESGDENKENEKSQETESENKKNQETQESAGAETENIEESLEKVIKEVVGESNNSDIKQKESENSGSTEEDVHYGNDEHGKEAREEHYEGDDASSSVVHETQNKETEQGDFNKSNQPEQVENKEKNEFNKGNETNSTVIEIPDVNQNEVASDGEQRSDTGSNDSSTVLNKEQQVDSYSIPVTSENPGASLENVLTTTQNQNEASNKGDESTMNRVTNNRQSNSDAISSITTEDGDSAKQESVRSNGQTVDSNTPSSTQNDHAIHSDQVNENSAAEGAQEIVLTSDTNENADAGQKDRVDSQERDTSSNPNNDVDAGQKEQVDSSNPREKGTSSSTHNDSNAAGNQNEKVVHGNQSDSNGSDNAEASQKEQVDSESDAGGQNQNEIAVESNGNYNSNVNDGTDKTKKEQVDSNNGDASQNTNNNGSGNDSTDVSQIQQRGSSTGDEGHNQNENIAHTNDSNASEKEQVQYSDSSDTNNTNVNQNESVKSSLHESVSSSVSQEEKEAHTDLGTLPETGLEGIRRKDAAAE